MEVHENKGAVPGDPALAGKVFERAYQDLGRQGLKDKVICYFQLPLTVADSWPRFRTARWVREIWNAFRATGQMVESDLFLSHHYYVLRLSEKKLASSTLLQMEQA